MIFVRPYLMTITKCSQETVSIPFNVEGSYEECETIAEKIDWIEKYLENLNNIRDQFRDLHWICAVKNDVSNAFGNEKLLKTRLRMLRKQLKKKN